LTISFPYVLCQGYSPLDFTVLDPHWGTLADWQNTIDEIHARGMYFMADFTVGTMGDLIGFEGCVNIQFVSLRFAYLSQLFERYRPIQSQRVRRRLEGPSIRSVGL
jgi:glycosidase